jgi:hypothetical protein
VIVTIEADGKWHSFDLIDVMVEGTSISIRLHGREDGPREVLIMKRVEPVLVQGDWIGQAGDQCWHIPTLVDELKERVKATLTEPTGDQDG